MAHNPDKLILDEAGRWMYDAPEMAAMCGVDLSTWWRYVKDGLVPKPIKLASGIPKWPVEILSTWIKRKIRER